MFKANSHGSTCSNNLQDLQLVTTFFLWLNWQRLVWFLHSRDEISAVCYKLLLEVALCELVFRMQILYKCLWDLFRIIFGVQKKNMVYFCRFYRCFSFICGIIWSRGAHVKILTGMLVLFFGVWNLAKSYFSRLANFLAIFLGFTKFPLYFGSDKFPAIFWVFQFLYYTLESFKVGDKSLINS